MLTEMIPFMNAAYVPDKFDDFYDFNVVAHIVFRTKKQADKILSIYDNSTFKQQIY